MLFVKTGDSNGQQTLAYLHHDHLGAPLQASDKQGQLLWAARYEPFGLASIITPQPTAERPTIALNLRLPGQLADQETGLHYNWNRYYDPVTGRYTQSDPIGLAGGINTYAYVAANPLSRVDPMGLWSTGGHDFFIDQLPIPLTPEQRQWIKDGSAYTDSSKFQDPAHSYMHAMSSKALSGPEARKKWCQFMREKYDSYNRDKSSSNPRMREVAYFNLGMMLHGVMDSTSPEVAP